MLLIDAIDSGSGAAIEASAAAKGVATIDYDRLTLGGDPNRYYVSFDNVLVGKTIGEGEVSCITAWKVSKPNILIMDGAPTDNNAKLFAQGYNAVLKPKFDDGSYVKVGEPAGTWTPSIAATTFQQQLTAHKNINAVVTPNDDNASAVIACQRRPAQDLRRQVSRVAIICRTFSRDSVRHGVQPITAERKPPSRRHVPPRAKPPAALVNRDQRQTSKDIPSLLSSRSGSPAQTSRTR